MKKYLLFLLLFFIYIFSNAQEITKTSFKQEGNVIILNYTIKGLNKYKEAEVQVYISFNAGLTFNGPLKAVNGDVGVIKSNGEKTIIWHFFDEYQSIDGVVVFDVRATVTRRDADKHSFLAYNASGTSAIGLTYGKVGYWGWYFRLKSNGAFTSSDYNIEGNSITNFDLDGYYSYSNNVKRTRFGFTAGGMTRLLNGMYLYAGGGFGNRVLLWNAEVFSFETNQKLNDIWAEYINRTYSGIELESGLMFKVGKINITTGVNVIDFGFFEINGGIGIFF